MAYTFEQLLAADPSNPSNIAQNGSITIFAPGDPTMAPLTITVHVIVAVPARTAVTRPLLSTVATPGSLDEHVVLRKRVAATLRPFMSVPVNVRFCDAPRRSVTVAGDRANDQSNRSPRQPPRV